MFCLNNYTFYPQQILCKLYFFKQFMICLCNNYYRFF